MPKNKKGGETLKYIIVFAALFAMGILLAWGMTGWSPWAQPGRPGFVEQGDLVRINFTALYWNGSPFDAGTLEFRPGTGQMRLRGLDEGVLGMEPGEGRTLNLTPGYAFGEYSPGLVVKKSRVEIKSSIITFDTTPEQFNATFGIMPEVGIFSSVDLPWRRVEILNFTNTTMTWRLIPPEGLKMGWPAGCEGTGIAQLSPSCYGIADVEVIEGGEMLRFAIEPYPDKMVDMGGVEARVIGADNGSIYLDFNHELAGQGFIYRIELLALEKG